MDLNLGNEASELFGEDQGRYLISTTSKSLAQIVQEARTAKVPAKVIGVVGGDTLTLNSTDAISISELTRMHERWFASYAATD